MISDEERKIVAANLRQYLKKYETPDWRAFCNIILGSGRLDNLRKAQAFDRLADLIDRPTCRNEEDGYGRSFLCGACGYEAWTYDDSGCDPKDFSFCPNCGAEVVLDGD